MVEQIETPDSAYFRSVFYVSGQYAKANDGHRMTGQMYVEQLTPINGIKHPWPLVFIHGAGQTGTVSSIFASSNLPWPNALL